MERIATVNCEVDKFGPGKNGFRAAQPGVSEPTYLSAEFFNAVQESLVRVIEAADLVPSSDHDQFLAAIDAIATAPVANLAQAGGANNIGIGETTVGGMLSDFVSIRQFGAHGNGVDDDQPAFQKARFVSNRIYFPRINGADTTYFLASAAVEMVTGTILRADPGVTISWPAGNNYRLFDHVTFESDINCTYRDSQTTNFAFLATPPAYKKEFLAPPGLATRRNRKALNCANPIDVRLLKVAWSNGDVFSAAAGTAAYDSVSLDANVGSFSGAFVRLGAYETVSAIFDAGLAHGPIGVILRGTLGYMAVYAGSAAGNYYTAGKFPGEPVVGNVPDLTWPELGQGRYNSFSPAKSIWSVSKVDVDRVVIKINGKALSQPFTSGVGEIFEVGFVSYANAPFTISGLTVERRIDAAYGMQKMSEIRIFADSTGAAMPSSWDKLLKPLLDGLYGVKVDAITNFGNVGDTFAQQYVAMTQNGFGNAHHVLVVLGTNNAQGQQDLELFKSQVRQTFTYITSNGRRPIAVIPGMWYGQAQAGGAGQATGSYDAAAPYRMWIERIACELRIPLVKVTEELPNPDPQLRITEPGAALLRDNIHQDALGHQYYASAIARAIVDDYMSLPETVEESMGPHMLGAATAGSDLMLSYGKDGLGMVNGTVGVAGVADGGALMTIPRYVLPARTTNISATALTADLLPNGTCWVNIDTVNGVANIHKAPAGTAFLILYASWKTAMGSL